MVHPLLLLTQFVLVLHVGIAQSNLRLKPKVLDEKNQRLTQTRQGNTTDGNLLSTYHGQLEMVLNRLVQKAGHRQVHSLQSGKLLH